MEVFPKIIRIIWLRSSLYGDSILTLCQLTDEVAKPSTSDRPCVVFQYVVKLVVFQDGDQVPSGRLAGDLDEAVKIYEEERQELLACGETVVLLDTHRTFENIG